MSSIVLRLAASVGFCAVLAACSDVELDVLLSRLDSAETVGAGAIDLDFGVKSHANVGIVENIDDGPGVESHPAISSSYSPAVDVTLGIGDRVDVQIGGVLGDDSVNPTLRAKVQLFGAPMSQARAGTLSIAASLGAGYFSTEETDAYNVIDGDEYVGELSATSADAALVVSYRPRDRTMFYGGPFVTRMDYDYRWRHYSQDALVERDRTDGSVRSRGLNMAFWHGIGRRWYWEIEFVHARISAERAARSLSQVGFTFGRGW
jgi:hypothetical protein